MNTVVKLQPVNEKRDPTAHLDAAKEANLSIVLIIGQEVDGTPYSGGNASVGEALLLWELAKPEMIFGD